MEKRLKKFSVPSEEHKLRTNYHLEAGKLLKKSAEKFNFEQTTNVVALASFPPNMPIASEDWDAEQTPFGPVGTLKQSGCVVYVSYYILKHYKKIPDLYSVYEWCKTVAKAGYRSWRFSKYPEHRFFTSELDVDEVKNKLLNFIPEIADCTTPDELITILGSLEGVGGSMYLIDNLIVQLAEENGKHFKAVKDTRLTSIDGIIKNLKNDTMVPIRVNNSLYHNDPEKTGGHYITIFGLVRNNVHVFDSSVGMKTLPFEKVIKAAMVDESLIAAWDLSII